MLSWFVFRMVLSFWKGSYDYIYVLIEMLIRKLLGFLVFNDGRG